MSPIVLKREFIITIALCAVILFLFMDKCGSSRKADELRGRWQEAIEIAKVEKRIKEEIIKEQNEKIVVLDTTIEKLNTTITRKDSELAGIEEELGVIKRDFESLEACQSQYDKLSIAFSLAKGIIKELGKPIEYYDEHGNKKFRYPEGTVTFNLNEKYKKQVIISTSYKSMYESAQGLTGKCVNYTKKLEKINRRLKLTSGLKTGIVLTMAGVVLYSLLKD